MRFPTLVRSLAAVALFLATSSAALPRVQTTIAGVVVEAETGALLENVTILAGGGAVAKTDAKGEFRLDIAGSGRYRIAPALRGYVFAPARPLKGGREPGVWVEISEGQSISGVQLRMNRSGSIVGKVQTAAGATLPGGVASVTLLRYVYDSDGRRSLGNVPGLHFAFEGSFVRMDDKGEFRFYDVPPGEYYLRVSGGDVPGTNTFYPATTDERNAVPIRVTSGEEVRLPTMVLPEQKWADVRIHYVNPAKFQFFQMIKIRTATLWLSAGRREGKDEDEVQLRFQPGHHDIFVATDLPGPLPNRPSPDALFGFASVDVANSPLDVPITVAPGFRIGGRMALENAQGGRSPLTLTPGSGNLRCRFVPMVDPFYSPSTGCIGAQLPAGSYFIHFDDIPEGQYVLSATANGRDVLAEGLRIDANTDLEIVFGSDGASLEGVVRDANGKACSDVLVAIVPDSPYRAAGALYRSSISDVKGKFSLRGIAPGNYRVFAWSDLPGDAFRNAEFLESYEEKGLPVHIERGSRNTADVKVLD
jgi:hypothetical protein